MNRVAAARIALDRGRDDIAGELSLMVQQLLRDRRLILLLFGVQVVAYSYLYTSISFGNHLYPNAFVNPYPSFRTTSQGRWLLDLILFAQGGSGVQSAQMVAATLLQACNATVFLRLLGVGRDLEMGILGSLFCLYPHFLDYYSFTSDHLALVSGDSLALIGLVLLYRCRLLRARLLAASICWFLALSIYAPKLALVCLLLLLLPVIGLLWATTDAAPGRPVGPKVDSTPGSAAGTADSAESTKTAVATGGELRQPPSPSWPGAIAGSDGYGCVNDQLAACLAARLGQGVVALLLAALAFWVSARLTITNPWPEHTHLSTAAEALRELSLAYRHWRDVVVNVIGGLTTPWISMLPALLAAALLIRRATAVGRPAILLIAGLLPLVPVALQSTWIINSQAWQSSGRLLTAHAYLIVFYLAVIILSRRLRWIAILISSLLAWNCFVFASQASQAIQLKSAYEFGQINRIAARLEPLISSSQNDQTAIVVFGKYPKFNGKDYIRTISVNASDLVNAPAFASYRQVDILNQVFGRRSLRPPNAAEVAQARRAAAGVQPWPAPGSVFRSGEILVVVLEPEHPGVDVTGPPSEGTSGKPGSEF